MTHPIHSPTSQPYVFNQTALSSFGRKLLLLFPEHIQNRYSSLYPWDAKDIILLTALLPKSVCDFTENEIRGNEALLKLLGLGRLFRDLLANTREETNNSFLVETVLEKDFFETSLDQFLSKSSSLALEKFFYRCLDKNELTKAIGTLKILKTGAERPSVFPELSLLQGIPDEFITAYTDPLEEHAFSLLDECSDAINNPQSTSLELASSIVSYLLTLLPCEIYYFAQKFQPPKSCLEATLLEVLKIEDDQLRSESMENVLGKFMEHCAKHLSSLLSSNRKGYETAYLRCLGEAIYRYKFGDGKKLRLVAARNLDQFLRFQKEELGATEEEASYLEAVAALSFINACKRNQNDVGAVNFLEAEIGNSLERIRAFARRIIDEDNQEILEFLGTCVWEEKDTFFSECCSYLIEDDDMLPLGWIKELSEVIEAKEKRTAILVKAWKLYLLLKELPSITGDLDEIGLTMQEKEHAVSEMVSQIIDYLASREESLLSEVFSEETLKNLRELINTSISNIESKTLYLDQLDEVKEPQTKKRKFSPQDRGQEKFLFRKTK